MKISAALAAFLIVAAPAAKPAFAEEAPPPGRVLDAAMGDWDQDGEADLALMTAPAEPDGEVGLDIYLQDTSQPFLKLAVRTKGQIWGNVESYFSGQAPFIQTLPNGSLALISHNDSMGRNRWERRLTLAYRDRQFLVAGYTYRYYDTINLEDTGECDYNLLAGKVSINRKPPQDAPKLVRKIEDWTDETKNAVAKTCGLE